jgi:hypothetical protein
MLNLTNILMGVDPNLLRSQGIRVNYKDLIVDTAAGLGVENSSKYVEDITVSLPGIPPEMERELTNAGRRVEAPAGMPAEFYIAHIQAHLAMPLPTSPLAKLRAMELIHSYQAQLEATQQIALAQAQQAQQNMPVNGPGVPGGAARGPVGASSPVRPQEQPIGNVGNTEGQAQAGIMSLLGGNTGQG